MLQTLKNFLKDVADAIREKTGKTDKIATQDMASEILTIQSEMPFEYGEFYHKTDESGNYTGVSFYGRAPGNRLYGPTITSNITEAKFLEGVPEIPESFARNNTYLKTVAYEGETITEIKPYAFNECTNLETVQNAEGENYIPWHVKEIGSYAFCNCKKLQVGLYNTPDMSAINTLAIKDYAFYRDSVGRNITNDELPAHLTTIGQYAFRYQQIPFTHLNAYSIGNGAFEGNNALTELTISGKNRWYPNGTELPYISSSAFASCSNLKTINVPWAEGAVANAPWGATNATINYNYKA